MDNLGMARAQRALRRSEAVNEARRQREAQDDATCTCWHPRSDHTRGRGVCGTCYDASDHGLQPYCNRWRDAIRFIQADQYANTGVRCDRRTAEVLLDRMADARYHRLGGTA